MAKYRIADGSFVEIGDDELMHWKYLKKKKLPNGKWRYYYDLDSFKKDVKSAVSAVTKTASKAVSSGKKTLQRYTSSATKTIKSVSNKISSEISSIVTKAKKNTYKYVAKVPTDDGTYRYFYSDEAYQAYIKGKNAVDKALDSKLNATASDTAKTNAKSFVANTIFGSFGEAVYNVVAPAFIALQVALTTPKSFSELKKADEEQSNDEHQKAINPDYDPTKYDNAMNCSFCTAAYDLRKRGYDVEANPISVAEAYTIEDICTWYKGAKSVSQSEVESRYRRQSLENPKQALTRTEMLMEELKSNGNGARGHLALYWPDGGGHDVIWEVENGEVLLRDCQNNTVSRTFSILSDASSYAYVRTDNVEPTDDVLRTVRNRKKG